jgi:C-methyltransferase
MTLHHDADRPQPDSRELRRSDVFDMLLAYKNTAVLTTGIELGIFDAIAAGASTATEVARSQSLDPRGTKLLLNALSSLGLLESDGNTYGLVTGAEKLLVRENPGFVGDMAKVMASAWEWDALRSLPDAVRYGGTVVAEHAETPQYAYWEDFAAHASAVAAPAAELTSDMLGTWAAGRGRLDVLDMACGHGLYGYTLAARYPNARVWSLDWPNVLPVALARADRMGIADRVSTIAGDMFEADLGGPYDAVMITNVLHHFSQERATELLRRAAGVLAEDGRIVVVGLTVSDAPPTEDAAGHLFSILMLIWTHEGEVHSLREYQEMLHGTGFTDVESRNVAASPLWVITARPGGQ